MTTRALQIECLRTPVIDYRDNSVCSGYTVNFYSAGTTDAKNIWTEKEKTNPYSTRTLGSDGTVEVYGDGVYKIEVVDTDDVTVYSWDDMKIQASTFTIQSKTDAYTATVDDDVVLCDGTFTLSLAPVAGFTQPLLIKNIGSGTITVDPDGSETIDGDSTVSLSGLSDTGVLYPDTDASTWRRVARFADLTATGTEINTVCDGDTAKNNHVHDIAEFVSASDGGPYIDDQVYNIEGLSEDAWHAIGPTGAGNAWTALDEVPTDADWIEVFIRSYAVRNSGVATQETGTTIYIRKNGSAVAAGASTEVLKCWCHGTSTAYGRSQICVTKKIPISSRTFDVYYELNNQSAGATENKWYLTGYGYNNIDE